MKPIRCVVLVISSLLAIWSGWDATSSAQSPVPAGFTDTVVLSGLEMPTAVRFSPDGRVFVAEKSGLIRVFDSLSDSDPIVFADLRTNVHNFWDRGLLGMALDPGFPERPYVYVLYTYDGTIGGVAPRWGTPGATSDGCPDPPGWTANGCDVSGRLSRLTAAGNVMTGTEQVLVHDWFQQFPSHSMGSLVFGADGALYASGGDGASWQFADYGQRGNPGGDPPVGVGGVQTPPTAEGGALRAQDIRTTGDPTGLNGSVIRIDPNTGRALPDNPNFSSPDPVARMIVGYGFRNPFRITARPGTREIWVGDVGWRDWEEIDIIADPTAPNRNYGWPCYEGRVREPDYDGANLNLCESLYAQAGAVTFSHYQYLEGAPVVSGESCSNTDSSLSGLAFYESGSYPSTYRGALFFADYTRRCIWVMFPGANGVPDPATRAVFIESAAFPVDLQTGPGGDLFYVDIVGGAIRRVRFQQGNPPIAVATANPTSGSAPLTVNFNGSQSSDPDGGPLVYAWDLDGNGVFGDSSIANPTFTYGANGTYLAKLRVTDVAGLTDLDTVTITVGNTAPTAVIDTPSASLRWRVGQTVSFSGHATDPQQGTLAASALRWSLIMNHCSSPTSCHQHFIQEYAGVASGSFTAPDHEYPSFLTLRLTATDAGGLQHTAARDLQPQTVNLTFQTAPAGLQLVVGGRTLNGTTTETFIIGSAASMSAPSPQTVNGQTYRFVSWSDGLAQAHDIMAPATATTYTATYRADTPPPGGGDIVLYASRATRHGSWRLVTDTTAASGSRIEHPDAGAPKRPDASANPVDYFDMTFNAEAGRAYRLWIRGKAHANAYTNDSVFVQFSGSVTSSGGPVFRIGTTSATTYILEDCSGCNVAGWGWQDNGYGAGVFGPTISFAATGPQTIRVQGREDGLSIDQIVLSPVTYLTNRPGLTKNDTTILPETGGPPPPGGSTEIVRHAFKATRFGSWRVVSDATAAGGARLEHPNANAPKIETPSANPADYFELTFDVEAGRAYRLWLRARAAQDFYGNDSVHVQFSGSVTASGTPVYRIGSTSATQIVLEECGGCPMSGWGWQDNGYGAGVLGPAIYFAMTGPQTIRIQGREDGISIDQVVLSAGDYITQSPGALRNDATILPERGGGGDPPPPPPPPPGDAREIVKYATDAAVRQGTWRIASDPTAAGGSRMEHPDANVPKIQTPSITPADYFETTFSAEAGRPYRLWLRARAAQDHYGNDSVHVQFSGSVNASGTPVFRIGTTSATQVVLEECSGCAMSGWGWQDNGYGAGVLGPVIYFAATGAQTVRIQGREDGISIDQIVLSSGTYLTASPGQVRDDTTILQRR
jgi:glucose/arabinose dehydrogenase